MTQRSPFGELIRQHRRQLGLSQDALVRRINQLVDAGVAGIEGRVSAKTIYNHEAECASPADFAVPGISTIRIYAEAFHFEHGSAERQRLIDAAEKTRMLKEAALQATGVDRTIGPEAPAGNERSPLSTGFVVEGREQAWTGLRGALDAVLAGEPQLVLIAGEAGIGKTRLLIELGRQSEAVERRLAVVVGRCIATTPYHAVREVLALLIGDIEGAGTSQLLSAKTGERLRRRAGQAGIAIDALAGLLRVNIATGRLWFARRIVWGIGQRLEQRGPEGIEEPFRVAAACVAALDLLGEPEPAARLLRESVELLRARAEAISSPGHRVSFLRRVPANRALLDRADASSL